MPMFYRSTFFISVPIFLKPSFNLLGSVPSTHITIGITSTVMSHSFFVFFFNSVILKYRVDVRWRIAVSRGKKGLFSLDLYLSLRWCSNKKKYWWYCNPIFINIHIINIMSNQNIENNSVNCTGRQWMKLSCPVVVSISYDVPGRHLTPTWYEIYDRIMI